MNEKPPVEDPLEKRYNWPLLYAVVLGELVVLVILFLIFTKVFD